jgi:hypothetical protein
MLLTLDIWLAESTFTVKCLPKVTCIISNLIDTTVREVAEKVAVVQAGHGKLGDHHLKESGEGGENTLLILVETETGGGGEVSTLHDTGGDEYLGVLLMDDLQSCRTLEVT